MNFIGCNVMGSRGVGSAIYQPINPIGGVACNFTTYFDGSGNFNIDFVDDGGVFVPETGEIKLNEDAYTRINEEIDYSSGVFHIELDFIADVSQSGRGELFSKISTITSAMLILRWTDGVLVVFMRDNTGATIVNSTFSPTLTKGVLYEDVTLIGDGAGNVTLDVPTVGTKVIAGVSFANGLTVNTHWLGCVSKDVAQFQGQIRRYYDSLDGTWNFSDKRLQGLTIDYNRYYDTTGNKFWILREITPTGAVYPYNEHSLNFTGVTDRLETMGDSWGVGIGGTDQRGFVQQLNFLNSNYMTDVVYDNNSTSGYDVYSYAETGFYTGAPSQPNGHAPDTGRNITSAISRGATMVRLEISENDNNTGHTVEETILGVTNIADACNANSIDLMVIKAFPQDIGEATGTKAWADQYNTELDALAIVKGFALVETDYLADENGWFNPIYQFNTDHPNDAGHALIGNTLLTAEQVRYKTLPYLVDDRYLIDGTCVIVPEGQSLIYVDEIPIKDENGYAQEIL
jgi:lysophospholipase L1-like esterase